MRLAVFSDVHSNHFALEACFAAAERRGADLWIFLGDYISDCAEPHRTMELLYRARRELAVGGAVLPEHWAQAARDFGII